MNNYFFRQICKFFVGVLIVITATFFVNRYGSPQPVILLSQPVDNTNNDSKKNYDMAISSARQLSDLLKRIKSGSIPLSAQSDIMDEIKKHSSIVESYYMKTYNCEIGNVFKDFLIYMINTNEKSAYNDKTIMKLTQYKKMVQNIENRCNN